MDGERFVRVFNTASEEEALEKQRRLQDAGISVENHTRININNQRVFELRVADSDRPAANTLLTVSGPVQNQEVKTKVRIPLRQRIRQAPISFAVIGVCVLIYVINIAESLIFATDSIFWALAPDLFRFWGGSWWSLLTYAFIHLGPLHLFFNLYWVWTLSPRLETAMGRKNFLFLIMLGAVAGGGLSILIAEQVTVGYSGILYAFVGYGFVAQRHTEEVMVTKSELRLFGIWLFVAIGLTLIGLLNIGNIGHIGGLVAGLVYGVFRSYRKFRTAGAVGIILLVIASLMSVYMPWSQTWQKRNDDSQIYNIIEKANTGNPQSQVVYGKLLTRTRATVGEGARRLRVSAESGFTEGKNSYAWFLATTPSTRHQDGNEALNWALQACEETDYRNAAILDTLAAAYARSGDFQRAVINQELAIEHYVSGNEEDLEGYRARLLLYKDKTPYTGEFDFNISE